MPQWVEPSPKKRCTFNERKRPHQNVAFFGITNKKAISQSAWSDLIWRSESES